MLSLVYPKIILHAETNEGQKNVGRARKIFQAVSQRRLKKLQYFC